MDILQHNQDLDPDLPSSLVLALDMDQDPALNLTTSLDLALDQ